MGRGEVGSFEALVTVRAPALLRLAVMLTGERAEAEDLLQSTLLLSIRHQERIVAMAAPAAYLRQVMLREHLRRRRRRPATPMEVEPVSTGDVDAVDGRDETWRLLATLRPRQRAVLVLRYYEDLPDADIARLLGCPEATVRSHARRGLTALRAQLTPASEVDA